MLRVFTVTTMHPKLDPTWVQFQDLQMMDSTFHVPEMFAFTNEPPGTGSDQAGACSVCMYSTQSCIKKKNTVNPRFEPQALINFIAQ